MKHRFLKRFFTVLAGLSCLTIVVCLLVVANRPEPLEGQAAAIIPPPASQNVGNASTPAPQPRRQVDFGEQQAQNEDIIAWLEVPGAVIDYPVLCTDDNAFYLEHDETKSPSKYGAIFIDMSNPIDFSAPMTVAYGHYTPDETHFTQLHRYKDASYFAENRDVYVYLPGAEQRYEVVAALLVGHENILYEKDYANTDTMRAFLASLENSEDPEANVELAGAGPDDRYLVLSTCTQAEEWSDQRFIVVARLVDKVTFLR